MTHKVLRDFPYSQDGIAVVLLRAGDVRDIRPELVAGLEREGFIGPAAPEDAAGAGADVGGSVEDTQAGGGADAEAAGKAADDRSSREATAAAIDIPANWADLPIGDLRSIARAVTKAPVSKKDECLAAIAQEIAWRQADAQPAA